MPHRKNARRPHYEPDREVLATRFTHALHHALQPIAIHACTCETTPSFPSITPVLFLSLTLPNPHPHRASLLRALDVEDTV
jgi:hypothetical protein